MIEIKRTGGLIAGARMRHAKRFRLGPILECRLALPHRVRGIERVVLVLRALEQVELDEARGRLQLRVAIEPDVLESSFLSALHAKAVHGDEHGTFSFLVRPEQLVTGGYRCKLKFTGTVKLFGWPSGGAGNGEARRTIARIS